HQSGQGFARTAVAFGVDAAAVRDPCLLLPVGRVQPAVGIEASRVGIDATVEQRGADAAHRLVPHGNAHAVEGALAHHLAEERDRQHRRDAARLLAHAVQVIELANRSRVQRTRRGLTLHLLTRAGADFRIAPEALYEEREAADDRSVCRKPAGSRTKARVSPISGKEKRAGSSRGGWREFVSAMRMPPRAMYCNGDGDRK